MSISLFVIFFIIVFIIGFLIGGYTIATSLKVKSVGRLRIDHSEPDEPTRMFLELKGVTPDMIAQCDFVKLEVVNENYLS